YENSVSGIVFISSSNNTMLKNSIYNNTGQGVYLISTSKDNIIINSSISGISGYAVHLNSNSHLTSLNSLFNKTNIRFADSSSTFTVQWFLGIKVMDQNNKPIHDVKVRVIDNENGTFNKSYYTNINGFVKWIALTEYIENSSGRIYFTEHNITATYDWYTGYSIPDPWMDQNRLIVIVLKFNVFIGYSIVLNEGWNLISIPFNQTNTSLESILEPIEREFNAVQWFNTTDLLDKWKHFHISKPFYMNDLKKINHTMGFWIHITNPDGTIFQIKGTRFSKNQIIHLYQGWNLVGYPSIINRIREKALNNLVYGFDIELIQYYDSKLKTFNQLNSNEYMKWGTGYWIYSNTDVDWVINNSLPPVHNLNKDLFYKTIQDGIDDAGEFDILKIAEGTFNEEVVINKSIKLIGDGKNRTIVNGQIIITSSNVGVYSIGLSNSSYSISLSNVSNIEINDILIINCTSGIIANNSFDVNLKNIEIQKGAFGILLNSSNRFDINNITMTNTLYGLSINFSENISIQDVTIQDQTYGIYFNSSININLTDLTLLNLSYGIYSNLSRDIIFENFNILNTSIGTTSFNSTNISFINSTIANNSLNNFRMYNSDINLINVTFNKTRIYMFDTNSTLKVLWFLQIITKDQLGTPINGVPIRVTDNMNGTFDNTYYTDSEGFTERIIITERIQNQTENLTFNPYNISAINPNYSFYDYFREVIINKTTNIVFISINTVSPTSILNVNRFRYYLTIQEAIDEANPYDTIRLSSDSFFENVNISKPITLTGIDKESTIIDGKGGICLNITSNDVVISNLNVTNSSFGININSNNGISLNNLLIFNNDYGIYSNSSNVAIEDCLFDINTNAIFGSNSSFIEVEDTIFNNEILDLLISESGFEILNSDFNSSRVSFLDSSSTLTVKWYLHVQLHDAASNPIEGGNVWIVDNENGTYDINFTTGP
ncbi:MAG: right-handed parallel beta-helix repeat-containing protein, partial [Candidatus Kariarchaeaceae archaeon]